MNERLRFSPAPTGDLHVGGARTALVNYLLSRHGGTLVLRIEDTDPVRTVIGAEESILEDLRWLGIHWEEGPDVGGPHAPYRQSARGGMHDARLRGLVVAGAAYRCFCEESALVYKRAGDEAAGRAPRYDGTCRGIAPEESDARAAAGEPHVWRFAVPGAQTVRWDDAVHGAIAIGSDDIGDFVLVRSDGTPTWTFASWADDIDMGITLVLRGDDHIPNTPRQILLSRALGLVAPRYGHLPLVTGADGAPLSKSAGDPGIAAFREAGYPAAAVVNHLALLGWSDPEGRDVLSMDELAEAFSLRRVAKAPSVHDPDRLRSLSARHLRALSHDGLVEVLRPFMPPLPAWLDADALVEAARDELVTARDIAKIAEAGVLVPAPADIDAAGRSALAIAASAIAAGSRNPRDGAALLGEVRSALKAAAVPPRVGLHALRLALTGRESGLPLAALLNIIGAEEALGRVRAAHVDISEPGTR